MTSVYLGNTNMIDVKSKSIEMVPLSEIILNENNRNSHSPEQIDRIVYLIKNLGYREPGVISNQSSKTRRRHAMGIRAGRW